MVKATDGRKNNKGNPQNLIPITKETAREIGRKGGFATARIRKSQIELEKRIKMLMSHEYFIDELFPKMKENDEECANDMAEQYRAVVGDSVTGADLMVAAGFIGMAVDRNPKWFELFRDQILQKPPEPLPDGTVSILAAFILSLKEQEKKFDLSDADQEGGRIEQPPT